MPERSCSILMSRSRIAADALEFADHAFDLGDPATSLGRPEISSGE